MPDVEIKRKVQLSREEVAARLITIARALVEQPVTHLELDGDSIRIAVPEQMQWEFELEVEGDETELEIELKWRDGGGP